MRLTAGTAVAAAVVWALGTGAAPAAHAAPATRDVLVVANNWDGTADIVDPRALKVLTRLNVVPDLAQRRAEIQADPDGARLLVSASTAGKVHVIDTGRGAIVGEFASGDQPHENNFSDAGRACASWRARAPGAWASGACAGRAATDWRLHATDAAGNESSRRVVRFRIRG